MRDVNGHLLTTGALLALLGVLALLGAAHGFTLGAFLGAAWTEFISWVYER